MKTRKLILRRNNRKADAPTGYAAMTWKELKALKKERGIKGRFNKDDLITELNKIDAENDENHVSDID